MKELLRTFIIKPVYPVDTGTFVISAQDEKVLRVLDLVCQQQTDRLQRLLSSIDVVTEEEVVGFRRETTVLEETEQIIVLAMDITANLVAKIG